MAEAVTVPGWPFPRGCLAEGAPSLEAALEAALEVALAAGMP